MQIIKFGLVGVLGTSAHYLMLILGVSLLQLSAVLASSIGFILGAVINHHFNRRFTFDSDKSYGETLLHFMLSASGLFLLNMLLMTVLVSWLQIQYLIAQVVTTGVVFLVGFVINKYLVFQRKKSLNHESN